MEQSIITNTERVYLRDLAKKQLEYAMLPIMKEREARWYKHNDLQGDIPMIHFEIHFGLGGTCEQELLPPLQCTSEAARSIERMIKINVLHHERIGDDVVVPPYMPIGWHTKSILFGLEIEKEHSKASDGRGVGHQFKHPIHDLQKDLPLLKPTINTVDKEGTMEWKSVMEDILGDILPVKMSMASLVATFSQDIVHLMGMEEMIYSIVDYPEEFHALIGRITRDRIESMKWMEKEGLLVLNNSHNGLCQGTFGFTKDLPGENCSEENGIKLHNLWGYMDSQETVSISPDMFGEFFFPYYNETAKNFGLLNYGCCEPVHPIWEKYISKLPNLRKVSISPWCDEEYMGQALKGSNVIYHRKPSPNFVGVGKELDESAFREHIKKTVLCAQGCKLEFSFRDVYSLGGNPEKPKRAVQIVREVIDENW